MTQELERILEMHELMDLATFQTPRKESPAKNRAQPISIKDSETPGRPAISAQPSLTAPPSLNTPVSKINIYGERVSALRGLENQDKNDSEAESKLDATL
jgi:hypothetical protein